MIFKYGTVQNEAGVMKNVEIIQSHKLCMIRNVNVKPDGSLYYPEPLDPDLVELIPQTPAEEKILLDTVAANSFYLDEARNRYLGLDTMTISMYMDGTNKKNTYLYNIPNVSSGTVPIRLFERYCIIGFEAYSTSALPAGATVFDVKNMVDDSVVMSITNEDTVPVTELYRNDLDVVVESGARLSGYVNNTGLDNPVLKVYLKQIYNPTGV